MQACVFAFELVAATGRQVAISTLVRFLVSAAVALGAAVAVAFLLTWIVRRWAPAIGLVDHPDQHRKLHSHPVPLGGGLAIYLSAAIVLGVMLLVPSPWRAILQRNTTSLAALLVSGALIVALGLVDDRLHLRGRMKLLGQLAASAVIVATGLEIQRVDLFGLEFSLGILAIPFTLFWLLGAINAVNLLDGIDGLATMIGFILVATIAAMSILAGHYHVAVIALVFAGSLLGFLHFNFPPASIFLGDAGSMLIGLVVGSLAILGALKGPGTVLLAAPLAVWTIPIFDSAIAILRRKLTGRSIYATDRGHLHHRLLDLLGTNRRVLACVAVFCAATSAATLVAVYRKNDMIALLACSSVVIILIATGIFGRAEMSLLANRLRNLHSPVLEPDSGRKRLPREVTVRLQGSRPWEGLWTSLTETAARLNVLQVRLDVNLPLAQEGYHAFWDCTTDDDPQKRWQIQVPLIADGQPVGYVTAVGESSNGAIASDLHEILRVLESFESQLEAILSAAPAMAVVAGVDEYRESLPPTPAGQLPRRHPR